MLSVIVPTVVALGFMVYGLYVTKKLESSEYTNRKLRAQVDSLRDVARAVKHDVDMKPVPTAPRARAVVEKLNTYMLDYVDQLLIGAMPPLKDPSNPVIEVKAKDTVCAAVGCGAKINFSKANSFKIVGAYKQGSSDRVLKFMCVGCTGKQVAA